MNATQLATAAYGAQNLPLRPARNLEHDLLARITARLKSLEGDAGRNFPALAAALDANRRLWTAFAADVADADNGLPAEVRARIFYLAEFTHHHSRKVLRGTASTAALVEVNAAIMAGLRNGTGAS